MAFPTRIIDHQDRIVEALPWPLGASERVEAWAQAVGRQVQDVEDATWALVHETSLDLARGVQLERWGERLGEPQGSLTVEEWRWLLKGKLVLRRSGGQVDDVTRALRIATGNQGPVYLYAFPPAKVGIQYFADPELSAAHRIRVRQWVALSLPAGIGLEHIIEMPISGFGLDSDDDALLEGLDDGLLGVMI